MDVKKINDYTWEIAKQAGMKVPARIYATEKLLEKIKLDRTLQQAMNVAHLKGILKYSYVMPDAHEGYGFPIGGVAAFDVNEGIISPGGIGYDINCGVRLLRTDFKAEQITSAKHNLIQEMFNSVPSGVGKGSITKLSKEELQELLVKGSQWALERGYGTKDDLETTEEGGRMKESDPSVVSERSLARGKPQIGTLGAGNHFLEIQKVDAIYDEKTARLFGITEPGQVTVMIHCGSRGFGHQVATDFIEEMEKKYGYKDLPDRELVNSPIQSELGQKYFKAMACGVNYAFANRQMIVHWVRESFKKIMGTDDGMKQVYDVCHNIAKIERHNVDGEQRTVCVHRKGATRAFGPGKEGNPERYMQTGHPVIIPGSMGTASYVLTGTKQAEELSFSSTAHGAGRTMSRAAAIHQFRGEGIARELLSRGIEVKSASWLSLAEEAPSAYKDIDEVIKASEGAEIAKPVIRLVPLGVVKG
ncbi:MAG: RtcB family protein [Candidatus Woesearchaeota archaeon]